MDMHRFVMIMIMAGGVMLLRAFPFLAFGRATKPSKGLTYLGTVMASASIAMLVIYSLYCVGASGKEGSSSIGDILHLLVSSALTIGLQVLFRNPLVSIVCGTTLYMILVR